MRLRYHTIWLLALAAASAAAWKWREERSWAVLFAGSVEVVSPQRREPYPPLVYERATNRRGPHEEWTGRSEALRHASPTPANWVDGEAREVLAAAIRRARRTGQETAGAMLDLQSPSTYREWPSSPVLTITYPPNGAVFPPNLAEPLIQWDDARSDLWEVSVGLAGQPPRWRSVTEERSWRIPPGAWEALKQVAIDSDAWIQVKGVLRATASSEREGTVQATPKVHFRMSCWPADEAVVYRLVTPPFNTRKTPDTFTREIGSFQVHSFLLARGHYCYNCHTFSTKETAGGKVAVQVRYMAPGQELPVYLGVYDIAGGQGTKVRLPFDIQMSTFMAWSPDGRVLAFSANQQLVTLSPVVFETQHAGQPTSDLAIYDSVEETVALVPQAAAADRLELLPRFSADGRRLVYCSAEVGSHPAETRYDLYAMSFANGVLGEPQAVPGAAQNGKSNYYPRFSPDGRWMSFCQSDGGILIKSSSDIYLMPADLSAPPRRLECNAEFAADSWHSWSSNSRWLVFASKRDDGIYARLYFTCIDDQGRASPAVRLPLQEEPLASFNIPEFVAAVPEVEEQELYEAFRVTAAVRSVRWVTAPAQDR